MPTFASERGPRSSSCLCDMQHVVPFSPSPVCLQLLKKCGIQPKPLRAPGQYAGLRNGGATCYMNAVFQQLFMQPGIRARILGSAEVSDASKCCALAPSALRPACFFRACSVCRLQCCDCSLQCSKQVVTAPWSPTEQPTQPELCCPALGQWRAGSVTSTNRLTTQLHCCPCCRCQRQTKRTASLHSCRACLRSWRSARPRMRSPSASGTPSRTMMAHPLMCGSTRMPMSSSHVCR